MLLPLLHQMRICSLSSLTQHCLWLLEVDLLAHKNQLNRMILYLHVKFKAHPTGSKVNFFLVSPSLYPSFPRNCHHPSTQMDIYHCQCHLNFHCYAFFLIPGFAWTFLRGHFSLPYHYSPMTDSLKYWLLRLGWFD